MKTILELSIFPGTCQPFTPCEIGRFIKIFLQLSISENLEMPPVKTGIGACQCGNRC